MKAGRNDPCPCGSGKKYKKCCLAKDQEKKRQQVEVERMAMASRAASDWSVGGDSSANTPAAVRVSPASAWSDTASAPAAIEQARPPDPHIEAINARWEEFDEADDENRIALFLASLDEPDLMDDELAFNMLDRIYAAACRNSVPDSDVPRPASDTATQPAPSEQPAEPPDDGAARDERERFDSLVETLRQRLPEVYAANKKYYVSWCMNNAVVCRRFDRAAELVNAMANDDDGDMEIFHRMLDQLAYHGQLAILCDATCVAWPRVRKVWDVVPWAVDEFASRAAQYVIFDHLERNPLLTADEPGLVERIEQFVPLKLDYFRRHLDILTGRLDAAWTMDDFRFDTRTSKKRRDDDDDDADDEVTPRGAPENLHDLSFAFVRYLHTVEGVPYTKADLAGEHIRRYVMDRINGELEPRPSMLDQMMHPQRHRRPPTPKPPAHALCPDRQTLDRYLAERLHFMSPQYYDAAALFDAVPAWLRFLESNRLIDADRHRNSLNALRPLAATIAKLWAGYHQDPALLSGLSATWGVPTETSGS